MAKVRMTRRPAEHFDFAARYHLDTHDAAHQCGLSAPARTYDLAVRHVDRQAWDHNSASTYHTKPQDPDRKYAGGGLWPIPFALGAAHGLNLRRPWHAEVRHFGRDPLDARLEDDAIRPASTWPRRR
jgi:hypothetical protein